MKNAEIKCENDLLCACAQIKSLKIGIKFQKLWNLAGLHLRHSSVIRWKRIVCLLTNLTRKGSNSEMKNLNLILWFSKIQFNLKPCSFHAQNPSRSSNKLLSTLEQAPEPMYHHLVPIRYQPESQELKLRDRKSVV